MTDGVERDTELVQLLLESVQIPQSKIDAPRSSVMGCIVLRAEDEEDDKRYVVFLCMNRGSRCGTVVVDWTDDQHAATEYRAIN